MLFNFVENESFPVELAEKLRQHPGPQKMMTDYPSQQSAQLGRIWDLLSGGDEFLRKHGDHKQMIRVYVYHCSRFIYYDATTLERLGDEEPRFYDWLPETDPDYNVERSLREFEEKHGYRPYGEPDRVCK